MTGSVNFFWLTPLQFDISLADASPADASLADASLANFPFICYRAGSLGTTI